MQKADFSRLYKKRVLQAEPETTLQPTTPLIIGLEVLQILENLGFQDCEPTLENGVRILNISVSIILLLQINGQNLQRDYPLSLMLRLLLVANLCFHEGSSAFLIQFQTLANMAGFILYFFMDKKV
jgi:hypothetical protein